MVKDSFFGLESNDVNPCVSELTKLTVEPDTVLLVDMFYTYSHQIKYIPARGQLLYIQLYYTFVIHSAIISCCKSSIKSFENLVVL